MFRNFRDILVILYEVYFPYSYEILGKGFVLQHDVPYFLHRKSIGEKELWLHIYLL